MKIDNNTISIVTLKKGYITIWNNKIHNFFPTFTELTEYLKDMMTLEGEDHP